MPRIFLLLALALSLVVASDVIAQTAARDQAKEAVLYDQLKPIAPKAVAAFQAGTQAMDNRDFDQCLSKFNEVLVAAPKFDPALRRLGYCLIEKGDRDGGYSLIQQAIDINRSPDNLISMAMARVDPGPTQYVPPEGEMKKSLEFATESAKLNNDADPAALYLIAELSLRLDQANLFRETVSKLNRLHPGESYTHYFNAIDLADKGDFDASLAEAESARSLGFDPDETSALIAAIQKAKDEAYPLAKYAFYIYCFLCLVAIWAAGLLGLFILGRQLSAKTLATIESSDPNDLTGGGHSSLKKTYRRLISFAGIYYYISLPIVVALVIVVTAALIYGSFMVGRIPIGFLIGLVFVGGGSIFFMFKSLIVKPKVEDPGNKLEPHEAPDLWELVRKVAGEIDTRPIDEIRITPGVEIAVYQRGKFRDRFRDKGERILILGVGSLNGFTTNAFRAVLAHEYGHFSNRDTAGGDVAFRVNDDMMRLADAIVKAGANTYHNLAFHFLRLYHLIFRRITHGASRLQEVLADRVAVHNYGAAAFAEGLEHVIRQKIVFDKIADSEISAALAARRKFANLYDLKIEENNSSDVETAFRAEFDRATNEDDTHPAAAVRVRVAEKIIGQEHDDLDGMVWNLFIDREQVTNAMNILVEKLVRGERYTNYHDTGISAAGD